MEVVTLPHFLVNSSCLEKRSQALRGRNLTRNIQARARRWCVKAPAANGCQGPLYAPHRPPSRFLKNPTVLPGNNVPAAPLQASDPGGFAEAEGIPSTSFYPCRMPCAGTDHPMLHAPEGTHRKPWSWDQPISLTVPAGIKDHLAC